MPAELPADLRPDPDDRLSLALHDLRSDVDRVPTPPAAAVRARGEQRTRRRNAAVTGGAALAVVAAVAVGLQTGGQVRGGAAQPAGPSRSVTAPVAPSPGTPTVGTPTAGTPSAPAGTPSPGAAGPAGTDPTGPPPLFAPSGTVAPGLFLTPAAVRGDDVASGRSLHWQAVSDPGGTTLGTCDVDPGPVGDVASLQTADDVVGAPVLTQRVRRYATPGQAARAVAAIRQALASCQTRLDAVPGNNLLAAVTPDPQPVTAPSGSTLDLVRVQVRTRATGAGGVEWTGVAATGTTVTTVVIGEPATQTSGWPALRRVTRAALQRLTTAGAAR